MIASGTPVWLVSVQVGVLTAILVYDLRRATSMEIAGEAPLRRRRALATAVALGALLVFHFLVGRRGIWGWGTLGVFGVACVVIAAISFPLKRLVIESRTGSG
jgi:hypothetical protein